MTELGRLARDEAEAARWYRKAAEAGDPNGMERYAYFAENGLGGIDRSFGEAIVWYKKAGEAGNPAALTRLGTITGDKKLIKRAVDAGYAPAMTALAKLQPEDAKQLYDAAAQLGEPEALFRTGKVQESAARGYGEALAALGKTEDAAKAGHVPSMIKAGMLRQAADTGDPEGLYAYGMSLPDKLDGANWLRRAAEKGHARAMTEVALRSTNAADRRRWFEAAAKAGEPEGMYRFGVLSGERDWIRKSAGKEYAPAMVALGEKEWLEKAAGAGYANAFTKLGQLERAAQMGDPEAKMLLGDAVRAKKPRQAVAYYVEAAKSGYAPAMTRLGDCSLKGEGTSRSEIDALKWYRDALASGDADAEARLKALGKTP
jgi:TPR repeat protein